MELSALSEKLGIHIEPQLLELALTHRSYSYENGQIPNNERLDFLGDAVLGFVVTAHIHETLTELPEGDASLRTLGRSADRTAVLIDVLAAVAGTYREWLAGDDVGQEYVDLSATLVNLAVASVGTDLTAPLASALKTLSTGLM